jgi:acyl carrier protein
MPAGMLLATCDTPLTPDELTAGERRAFSALPPSGPRQRTWLIARRALRRALAASGRPADTSRYPMPNRVVSVSHTARLAVAAVLPSACAAVTGLGVDIELGRRPKPASARFFLSGPEQRWLAAVPAENQPDALLRLWTVKEAVFKADRANAVATLGDYEVAAPAGYRGHARRTRPPGGVPPAPGDPSPQETQFRYRTVALPRGFLSVAIALSPSWRTAPMQTVDFGQVAQRVSSLISVPVARLTPETKIAELVPDSFTFVEVAVDFQEEYDVVFDQEDLKALHTLGDLAALLDSRRADRDD